MAFLLKSGMSLGAMSAEDDAAYLENCFIETSDLDKLGETSDPKCIALGRTGSGKSALLLRLHDSRDNSIRLNPESLSLNYVSNSDILKFFEDQGIDLDVFYQLLWRHVLTIELLQLKKQFNDERSSTIIANLFARFNPNEKKKRALEYLFNYGTSFWSDTEHRIREVVHNIESSLENQMGFSVSALRARLSADAKDKEVESVKRTTEIIHKAQKVVNGVQIQELNAVMDFLADDVFNDKQEKYYIVIDDLDTGWVHDDLRFKLVRALIETLRKFRRIQNLKIIIGLRADLLETIMTNTAAKGFQAEKYDDMMLRIKWSSNDLKALADARIGQLFKDQYTKAQPNFEDLFPARVGNQDAFEYILDRTLHRPRDVIAFMNECLAAAAGAGSVSQKAVRNAEGPYSKRRLRSLADEWREVYGDLEIPIQILYNVDVRFHKRDLTDKLLEDFCINLLAGDVSSGGSVFQRICQSISEGRAAYSTLRNKILEIFYIIGAIGVKPRNGSPYEWSYKNEPVLNSSILGDEATFAIHPMLFRVLNKRAEATSLVA